MDAPPPMVDPTVDPMAAYRRRTRGRRDLILLAVAIVVAAVVLVVRQVHANDGPHLEVLPADTPGPSTITGGPVTVPSLVVRYAGGGVAVLVGVRLEGRPYAFILDSGADGTVLDTSVATALHLPLSTGEHRARTLKCSPEVRAGRISDWQLGSAHLAAGLVGVEHTGFQGVQIGGVPVAGLLGADVQSSAGRVDIDYQHSDVVFDAPTPAGGKVIATRVVRPAGSGTAMITDISVPTSSGTRTVTMLVDTGASRSELQASTAASLGLPRAGAQTSVKDAGGCSDPVGQSTLAGAKAGSIPLPALTVITAPGALPVGDGVVGLLGSDALGSFGSATFDWTAGRITLGT